MGIYTPSSAAGFHWFQDNSPSPSGPFPRRPICYQIVDWVEQGIAALSAHRSAASPTMGTPLQRMLVLEWCSSTGQVGGLTVVL